MLDTYSASLYQDLLVVRGNNILVSIQSNTARISRAEGASHLLPSGSAILPTCPPVADLYSSAGRWSAPPSSVGTQSREPESLTCAPSTKLPSYWLARLRVAIAKEIQTSNATPPTHPLPPLKSDPRWRSRIIAHLCFSLNRGQDA